METRYKLTYETNGEGTEIAVFHPSISLARRYAKKLSSDGTAWPDLVVITRQVRESRFHEWADDMTAIDIEYVGGNLYSSDADVSPR